MLARREGCAQRRDQGRPGGTWSLLADLSAFQAANPVAEPDEDDFEPDGTWYSMTSFGGVLYPMDSNHGELDRVTTGGAISRVVDISAAARAHRPDRNRGSGPGLRFGWKHEGSRSS